MKKLLLLFLFLLCTIIFYAEELNILGFSFDKYPSLNAILLPTETEVDYVRIDGVPRNVESEPLAISRKQVAIGILYQDDLSTTFLEKLTTDLSKDFFVEPLFTLWRYSNEFSLVMPTVTREFIGPNLTDQPRYHSDPSRTKLFDSISAVTSYLKNIGDLRFLIIIGNGDDTDSMISDTKASKLILESGVIPIFIGNWKNKVIPLDILRKIGFGMSITVDKKDYSKSIVDVFEYLKESILLTFQALGDRKEKIVEFGFENLQKEQYSLYPPPWKVIWYTKTNPIKDGRVELSFDITPVEFSTRTVMKIQKYSSRGDVEEYEFTYSPGTSELDKDILSEGIWLYLLTVEGKDYISGNTVFSKFPGPKIRFEIPSLVSSKRISVDLKYEGGVPLSEIIINNKKINVDKIEKNIILELESGYNNIEMEYIDHFGRTFGPVNERIFVDSEEPTIVIDELPKYYNKNQLIVMGTVKDNLGLLSINVNGKSQNLQEKESYNFSIPVDIYPDNNKINVIAEDLAGNKTEKSFEVIGDFILPNIESINYDEYSSSEREKISINATDNTEVSHLTINGKRFEYNGNSFTTELQYEGVNQIDIVVYDVTGNSRRQTIQIIRDTIKPEIQINDSTIILNQSRLTFEVIDNQEIKNVYIENRIATKINTNLYSVDLGTIEPGAEKTMEITAVDLAGNISKKTVRLINDIKPPQIIEISSPFFSRKISFSDDFGLKKLTFQGKEYNLFGTSTSVNIPFNEGDNGTVVIEDIAGNTAEIPINAIPWYRSPYFVYPLVAFLFFWIGLRIGIIYIKKKYHNKNRLKL
ncbi:MAG: cadherin-like beta sandwich domain-containing protein [Petrotogales bacterium]